MRIFNKLTIKTLKKNRTRTIVTIIGIILSATMICAVTTFANSLITFGKESAIYSAGEWHLGKFDTDYQSCKELADNEQIKDSTTLERIGYANVDVDSDVAYYKPYIHIAGTQDNALDFLPVHITSGKYPTSSSEILLPNTLSTEGEVNYEIGDKITLDVGQRTKDGSVLWQDDPYFKDSSKEAGEKLVNKETKAYTVVGFYDSNSYNFEQNGAPGFTGLTISDNTPSDTSVYSVYAQMKKPSDAYKLAEKTDSATNSGLLRYYGVFRTDGYTRTLYGLAAIVIGLIMVGSIALIYNAFSISVSERTKQFGLLSSIGATNGQLRRMVFFEALVVSAISIPIGIIIGIGGIGITLFALSSMMHTMYSQPVDFKLSISFISVITAIVVSLLTVLISAWIPSIRATKASAIDAIRQSNDIKIKSKKIKTSKIISKLFGIPGVIADKHYKRNKKKYRTTVLSLFMSIVLFVSASAFTMYLTNTSDKVSTTSKFDISATVSSRELNELTPEQLENLIKSADSVTDVTLTKDTFIEAEFNEKDMSVHAKEMLEQTNQYAKEFGSSSNEPQKISTHLCFVADDIFKAYLKEIGLKETDYMNPENPQAIAIDVPTSILSEENKNEKACFLNCDTTEVEASIEVSALKDYYYTGEEITKNGTTYLVYQHIDEDKTIEIPKDEVYVTETLKIGYITEKVPSFLNAGGSVSLIYPMSVCEKMFEDSTLHDGDCSCFYSIKSSNHKASYEAIKTILDKNNIETSRLFDAVEAEESDRNLFLVIKIFSTGFIILISLIATANVFNTISTNIALRRREFAMLKSIGMTKKEMNKMMCFECLLYGTRALMAGLPVSILITYLIYNSIKDSVAIAFTLPWGAIGIVVLSVFLVVSVTMIYAMHKIKKDNPIDALKNENL